MLPAPDKRWGAWETAGKGSLSLRHFMKRTVQEKFVIALLDDLVEVFLVHIWHLYSGIYLLEFAIQIPPQTGFRSQILHYFASQNLFQPLNKIVVDVASVKRFNSFLLQLTRLIWLKIGEGAATGLTRD
jgi:hypothetical protein